MHRSEAEVVLVVHDMPPKLRACCFELQIWTKQIRLSKQSSHGGGCLIVEPRSILTPRHHSESNPLDGCPCAFVRHTWVHIPVEHNCSCESGGNVPVEVYHRGFAWGVVTGVPGRFILPPCWRSRPHFGRRVLDMQSLPHIRTAHVLCVEVILSAWECPI